MAFKIVRNDITKMTTEAIVNTASASVNVGPGCDTSIYTAAGFDELLNFRREQIGTVREGDAFVTPGFKLPVRYIIHTVSPEFHGGDSGEDAKLRSCYKKSLKLAKKLGIKSISFPLIAAGAFGYPREEAMRIAADEINAFLLNNEMDVYLVVFDTASTLLGERLYPNLESYIDQNYVTEAGKREYVVFSKMFARQNRRIPRDSAPLGGMSARPGQANIPFESRLSEEAYECECASESYVDFEEHESRLEARMKHLSDTFSEYLLYLIHEKNMENAEVWKRAIVDKKIFSKIKNNVNYHPNKLTALCLCVGAKLNLDESKDLLARAGYALSPCDKTDIIFSYFIENGIYDMIELDIQLEEHGLPCIIT